MSSDAFARNIEVSAEVPLKLNVCISCGGRGGDLKDGSRRRSIFRAADVGIFLTQS